MKLRSCSIAAHRTRQKDDAALVVGRKNGTSTSRWLAASCPPLDLDAWLAQRVAAGDQVSVTDIAEEFSVTQEYATLAGEAALARSRHRARATRDEE